jgi:hypothetical protein
MKPAHKADHSAASRANIKNPHSYASASPLGLHCMHSYNFIFEK